jgi:hypothetical protein
VQNVIGTYYITIFEDRALKNCTKVNTRSEQETGEVLRGESVEIITREIEGKRTAKRNSKAMTTMKSVCSSPEQTVVLR